MEPVDCFDRIYTSIHDKADWRTRFRINTLMRIFIRVTANLFLPMYYYLKRNKPTYRIPPTEKQQERLIVTLTSFPARISRLWLVIETILHQTCKPDMIVLWLSREQFPEMTDVPQSLRRMQERGLQIELVSGDVRSHKKYCYCLGRYPEDIMLTIDDDIFYDTRMVERLMKLHQQYPSAIITNHAHRMTYTDEGKLRPYMEWENSTKGDKDLFVVGIGGNLYPPHSLHPLAADTELAYRLTPTGDDIWLNAMARLQGTPIVHAPYRFVCQLPVLNRHNVDLSTNNVPIANDQQIKLLHEYVQETYGVEPLCIKVAEV